MRFALCVSVTLLPKWVSFISGFLFLCSPHHLYVSTRRGSVKISLKTLSLFLNLVHNPVAVSTIQCCSCVHGKSFFSFDFDSLWWPSIPAQSPSVCQSLLPLWISSVQDPEKTKRVVRGHLFLPKMESLVPRAVVSTGISFSSCFFPLSPSWLCRYSGTVEPEHSIPSNGVFSSPPPRFLLFIYTLLVCVVVFHRCLNLRFWCR